MKDPVFTGTLPLCCSATRSSTRFNKCLPDNPACPPCTVRTPPQSSITPALAELVRKSRGHTTTSDGREHVRTLLCVSSSLPSITPCVWYVKISFHNQMCIPCCAFINAGVSVLLHLTSANPSRSLTHIALWVVGIRTRSIKRQSFRLIQ